MGGSWISCKRFRQNRFQSDEHLTLALRGHNCQLFRRLPQTFFSHPTYMNGLSLEFEGSAGQIEPGIFQGGNALWTRFGRKYPGYYKVQCKCKRKYTNTNTQIQSRKYKYRHKYKYAVTTAVARSFRKLNSDGFWLLRNANPAPRSEVMTVWIFPSGVPLSGWRLLSR